MFDLEAETEKFVNYWTHNGKPGHDWDKAWRNWMLKAQEYQAKDRPMTTSEGITMMRINAERELKSIQSQKALGAGDSNILDSGEYYGGT